MKKPILNAKDLTDRIAELKAKKQLQEEALQTQFTQTIHTLRPGNLIKQGISKLSEMPVATGLIGTGVNIGIDLLTKKLLGSSEGTVKKLAKGALRYGITKFFGERAGAIKAYASVIAKRFLSKKEKD